MSIFASETIDNHKVLRMDFSKQALFMLMLTGGTLNCLPAAATKTDVLETVKDLMQVNGKVVDEKGDAIIGATVAVDGTSLKTITDVEGNFTLSNVRRGAMMSVSYIGYERTFVKAAKDVSIELKEDDHQLKEVVVVGYGRMQRKDITSSITTVNSDDLNKGVFTTPAEMLQGKVPGLTVTTSSNPNEPNSSVILRGASTLREGDAMQPYYIVDGIPGVDLSLVAADDIESIDVLRDATATAIYGSKAANGVIIVTTKKGKRGSAHVSYNGYVAIDNVAKDIKLATADDLETTPKPTTSRCPATREPIQTGRSRWSVLASRTATTLR